MKKYLILSLIILIGVSLTGYFVFFNESDSQEHAVIAEVLDREVVINIEPNMTFSIISEQAGLDHTLMQSLFNASEEVYNLSKVKAGKDIKFVFDKDTDIFKQLIYPIDTEEELYIQQDAEGNWLAERITIEYELKLKTVEGSIESSLYESAVEQDIDIRAIIDLAEIFAWTIDFGMGIRVGDTYKFIFEERYRNGENGEYVMPGRIIAAKFVNDGKLVEGYYFDEGLDEEGYLTEGYFHPDGASVQKIFLKNPVSYKYITSGFTTGRRYISAFNISTGHRAVDYAAASGSPIRSVGTGQVVHAGWNGSYGNFVSIRHNETFTTNYAHMSKIYVSYGQRVEQGEYIGAVGSTGLSTGPHLHFEMVKFGTKINPLTVELPSDKSVLPENMDRFKEHVAEWQGLLN